MEERQNCTGWKNRENKTKTKQTREHHFRLHSTQSTGKQYNKSSKQKDYTIFFLWWVISTTAKKNCQSKLICRSRRWWWWGRADDGNSLSLIKFWKPSCKCSYISKHHAVVATNADRKAIIFCTIAPRETFAFRTRGLAVAVLAD